MFKMIGGLRSIWLHAQPAATSAGFTFSGTVTGHLSWQLTGGFADGTFTIINADLEILGETIVNANSGVAGITMFSTDGYAIRV